MGKSKFKIGFTKNLNSRMLADSQDVYAWLSSKNKKIAEEFFIKMDITEKSLDKKLKKIQEKINKSQEQIKENPKKILKESKESVKKEENKTRWIFLPQIIVCWFIGHNWEYSITRKLCMRCNLIKKK